MKKVIAKQIKKKNVNADKFPLTLGDAKKIFLTEEKAKKLFPTKDEMAELRNDFKEFTEMILTALHNVVLEIKQGYKFKTFLISFFLFTFTPVFSFAEGSVNTKTFKNFANDLTTDVIATLGTMFMAAAFMFFFYGVAMYIWDRANGKNGDEIKKANDFMLWGVVGLFIMVSIWGIIKMAQGLLGENFAGTNQISINAVNFGIVPGEGAEKEVGATNLVNPAGPNTPINPAGPNTPINPAGPTSNLDRQLEINRLRKQ